MNAVRQPAPDSRMDDMAMLRIPPHSIEAERAVLGALLLDSKLFWQLDLVPDDFYRHDHGVIYRAISELARDDKNADAVTTAEHIEAADESELERLGGLAYLATLARDCPTTANTSSYADIVRERSRRRTALRLLGEGIEQIYAQADAADVLSNIQSALEGFSTPRQSLSMKDVLARTMTALKETLLRRNKGIEGITTGVPTLDHVLGGFYGAKLIILAGRPSTGKTALAHQICMRAARAGIAVGKIELEMSAEEIGFRSMSHAYQVNLTDISDGEPSAIEQVKAGTVSHNIRDYPIYSDETAYTFQEIVSRLTEWHRKYNIQLAVIDYLQLIQVRGGGRDNRAQDLGEITRGLRRLAKRLNMPIVLLSQFNRELEKHGRRPMLSDLRDSGEIEQDAHAVIALHGSLETDNDGRRPVEVGILKNRGGKVGWLDHVSFKFNGRFQRFEEEARDGSVQRSGSGGREKAPGATTAASARAPAD